MTGRFQGLQKAEHGGLGAIEEHGFHQKFLDYSASLNPVPPLLNWKVSSESIIRYPDDSYSTLKSVIARHHNRRPEEICVGNGSVEIMRTLCHTILSPGTHVYIPDHTFSEYALSASLAGAEVVSDPGAQVDLTFLCNPENPSGILTERKTVLEKLEKICGDESSLTHKKQSGYFCVDEAFIDLADPTESVADITHPGLFVLRSLTKSFSMAGVRFGYGIGDPELIAAMEVMRPPWTVNVFAEAMALEAFAHYDELESSRKYIRAERERISSRCIELGLIPSQASANYILLDTGRDASTLTKHMKKQGILIRDCTSFGLLSSIRIAIGRKEENDLLLSALEKCLHS